MRLTPEISKTQTKQLEKASNSINIPGHRYDTVKEAVLWRQVVKGCRTNMFILIMKSSMFIALDLEDIQYRALILQSDQFKSEGWLVFCLQPVHNKLKSEDWLVFFITASPQQGDLRLHALRQAGALVAKLEPAADFRVGSLSTEPPTSP
ncbi:hypothetical protein PoB_005756400 [Plakobranchus ocellatus]|uniref:Uncharacterized protein n=1 Tax=Plakobranchus ocellatus TaxID=259542 RepID=A0AAV4CIR7_9GAST|nr:hypothetical protein PoB_005756400 [Plakobranchus ocellatus]